MTTSQIAGVTVSAILLFWAVGAYNRLVRLRSDVVQRFAPVDERIRERGSLLLQQLDALTPALLNAATRLEVLSAACRQIESACGHARPRPASADAITSLRLAEGILAEARARLPAQGVAGVDLGEVNARLVASDATLSFARQQFNEAVVAYNTAIHQFPTRIIATVFGLNRAAAL